MNTTGPANLERLHDLLADRATQGLPPDDQVELDRLLEEHPEVDPFELDWAATVIDLPWITPEPLPDHLRANVQHDAVGWLAREQGLQLTPATSPPPPATRSMWWPLLAAACVALAALAWWPRSEPSLAEQFNRLASTSAVVPWTDVGEAGITGDIVWDNVTQSGVMKFTGLAVNDPTKLQYQLWIFDGARPKPYDAVDGGVFDVDMSTGDVYVKVDAKLGVTNPTLFAVTTEPPGGVVKHETRGDFAIILTAAVTP